MSTVLDPTTTDADADAQGGKPEKKKKKGKRKLLIILVVVLVVGAGGYEFTMGGKKPAAGAKAAPKPGPLVAPDAVTVNLAGGHYLRVGLALQFTDKVNAATPPDGSAALDQTITYLTGQSAVTLETPAGVANAKAALLTRIAAAYPKDPLMGVLFTSFVIQ